MAANMDRIKLLVVGDSGVGKSTLVNGLVTQTPCYHTSSTIGSNVEVLPYQYNGSQGQRNVFLEFWDVGGSSGHKHSRSIFYPNLNGLILVHDLSNRKSFSNLHRWLKEVLNNEKEEMTGISINTPKERYVSGSSNKGTVPVLIVGTKEDQSSGYQIEKSARSVGLSTDSDVFFLDMNCYQQSQLLPSSGKWDVLNTFLEKVVEYRFYPSAKYASQESEYWRGRKKLF